MQIIGLGHKMRQGKDTLADAIIANDPRWVKMSFAEPLKEVTKLAFGWTDAHVYGDLKTAVDPHWGVTPRWALQMVGTELFRQRIRQDFWVHVMRQRLWSLPDDARVLIVDVRFPEEAEMLRDDFGALLVRVDRDPVPTDWRGRLARRWKERGVHSSETALNDFDAWDVVVKNTGSLHDMSQMALNVVISSYARSQRTRVLTPGANQAM